MTATQAARKMPKMSSPNKKREHTGLCSTCKHSENCVYPRPKSKPIMFCEEFDVEEGKTMTFIPPKKEAAKTEDCNLKGLCRNCEHRETCTLPKAECGVWHCEEYK